MRSRTKTLVALSLLICTAMISTVFLTGCESCTDKDMTKIGQALEAEANKLIEKSTKLEASFADSDQANDWDLSIEDYGEVKHGDKSAGNDEYYLAVYQSRLVPGFKMQNVLKVPADDSRDYLDRTQGLFKLHTEMMLDRVPDDQSFMTFWAKEFPDRPIANIGTDGNTVGTGRVVYHMTAPKGGVRTQADLQAKQGPTVAFDEKTKTWSVVDRGE